MFERADRYRLQHPHFEPVVYQTQHGWAWRLLDPAAAGRCVVTERERLFLFSDITNPDTWTVWADMVAQRDAADEALLAYRALVAMQVGRHSKSAIIMAQRRLFEAIGLPVYDVGAHCSRVADPRHLQRLLDEDVRRADFESFIDRHTYPTRRPRNPTRRGDQGRHKRPRR